MGATRAGLLRCRARAVCGRHLCRTGHVGTGGGIGRTSVPCLIHESRLSFPRTWPSVLRHVGECTPCPPSYARRRKGHASETQASQFPERARGAMGTARRQKERSRVIQSWDAITRKEESRVVRPYPRCRKGEARVVRPYPRCLKGKPGVVRDPLLRRKGNPEVVRSTSLLRKGKSGLVRDITQPWKGKTRVVRAKRSEVEENLSTD